MRFLAAPTFAALATLALAALAAPLHAAEPLAPAVARLEAAWAQASFGGAAKPAQATALDAVTAQAAALTRASPGRAEPLVWQGVAMVAKAGVEGGLAGFRLVSDARRILETAERLDPAAAGGLGLSQLGILYYQVPGPPLAFGSRRLARSYLTRALAVDAASLAANLAMGDFLVESGKFADAEPFLRRALAAPPRPAQPVAERGRRAEAAALLRLVATRLGKPG